MKYTMKTAVMTEQKMNDVYPSRTQSQPQCINRQDPVVYSRECHPHAGMSEDQINDYERDGYLILDSVFEENEITQLNQEIDKIAKDPLWLKREELILEPDDNQTVRSIFAFHQFSPLFKELVEDRRIREKVNFLLDDATYVHQARINTKNAFSGKEFYWHSDFETWHIEDGMPRMRALSAMIMISDNKSYNGPLLVMPGSHKQFIGCIGETPEDHFKDSLRKQQYGVPDPKSISKLYETHGIKEVICPPGSLVLFDCNLMHGSNSNITPIARRNIFLVYNAQSNRLMDPFGGMRPRPNFIAERMA